MSKQYTESAALGRSDEKIIQLYFARDELAITETDQKYGRYLLTIAQNILHHEPDSEECLNDTYLSAWNSIPPTVPRVLAAYLAKIIRHFSLNRWKELRRGKRVPPEAIEALSDFEGILPDPDGVEAQVETHMVAELIGAYLDTVTPRYRYIFMSRCYYLRPIDEIAELADVSVSAVKKAMAKMKRELRTKLEEGGVAV